MTCGLENTTRFQGRAFKRHFIVVLFTTRRRSSEQGTVFTPVCLFTGESLYDVTCLAAWSHVPSGWVSGPIFLLEGLPDSDPWTETPLWTEPRPGQRIPTQRPPGQTPSGQKPPWAETPHVRCVCVAAKESNSPLVNGLPRV